MTERNPARSNFGLPSDAEKVKQDFHSASQGCTSSSDDLERQKEDEAGRVSTRAPSTEAGATRVEGTDDTMGEDSEDGEASLQHRGRLSIIVSRTISRTTSRSSWNPGPPPDGGSKAWTAGKLSAAELLPPAAWCVLLRNVVVGGHLVIMNTWGYISSFGVFQAYYSRTLDLPPSTISWIGSMQIFLLFFVGTFAGRLSDAGYFRHLFLLGSAFQMLGIFTTAACTEYWQLFLAQGVCMGLGNGCLFCPTVATVSTYFSSKRALAVGITASGSATGGLVFPGMARQLLASAGFAWTIRAIGFIQLGALVVAFALLRTRVPPRRSGAIVEWSAFRDAGYSLYAAGSFFCFMGIYFAFYYVASFSRDIIGVSYTESLNLLLVMNGVGFLGRLVPNHVGDRVGTINVFAPIALGAGVLLLAWIAVDSRPGLYVWTCLYGIFAGGIQSLFPAALTSLTTDLRKAGVRMGMVFTIVSFATLTGAPIAGAIIGATKGGRYYGAQAFAGTMLLLGSGFLAAARVAKTRKAGGGWRAKV